MKNIHEILKGMGVEIPEDKKAEFDEAVKSNYTPVAEAEKLRTARDNYKSQLETTTVSLKEFEGVDVKNLQGKITSLNEQLASQKAEYENKLAEQEFNTLLDSAISDSGAKNAKAVKALLDLDALKASKNQADDISKALETVKSENDYMFKSDEPYQNSQIVGKTGGNFGSDSDAAMRAAMGLPPEKK